MLKEYHLFFRRLMICFDLFIVTISFFLSPFLFSDNGNVIQQFGSYFILLPALLGVGGVFLHYQRKNDFNTRNVLIVGTGKRAQHFINTIGKNVEWGINVIGLIDNDAAKKNT